MHKVLVTGGLGFIGGHLVDALVTQGVNVCLFDNLTAGRLQNIKQGRIQTSLSLKAIY